ncbi:MAG: SDR family NAD(P)-dependent oxidoreductase [Actinomycetia bacterium]|nr:SDR family NAD(P)-dependent oxidoreductase [Actinomycetes bacterium]
MDWTINGRSILVTGGSSGIGKATAMALAASGGCVTITSRSASRAKAAAEEIRQATGTSVSTLVVDFASLESVRSAAARFVDTHSELVVLVNNAGVVKGSVSRTVDGHETTFATNHLGPFLFTSLLVDLLVASAPARVINTSSVAHTYAKEGIVFDDLNFRHRRYKFMEVYGHSKLANILHVQETNNRFGSRGITAVAVHPGVVRTGLGSGGDSFLVGWAERLGGRWMRTPQQGADTIVWLATEPHIDTSEGCYFEDRKPSRSTHHARDMDQASRLWDVSTRLTAGS